MKCDVNIAQEMHGALACMELICAIQFPAWFRTMVLLAQSVKEAAERVVREADGRLNRGGQLPEWLIHAFDSVGFEHTLRMDPLSNPMALMHSLTIWTRRAEFLGITDSDNSNFRRLLELRETRAGNKDRTDEWWQLVQRVQQIS